MSKTNSPCAHAVVAVAVAACCCATNPTLAVEASARAAAVASIEIEQLRSHVDTLAADSFEGREGGSRGGQAAASYLMTQLKAYGLQGGGEGGSYFQSFRNFRNVLAVLPGSDPRLKDEFIVVGAHFDHVGFGSKSNSFGPSGYIHNGADDNASGTSALLELAEAFTKLPEAPKRSILFAFWDAEEKGLLGSEHWANNPTVPLASVKCNLNVDMVGRLRDEKLVVYGTRTSAGLRRMLAECNEPTNLKLSYVWWINPQSDHYSFFRRKIPVLMFHTGLHDDYHRPSDDAEKIEVEGVQKVTQLMFQTTLTLAEREESLPFRATASWESTSHRKEFERAPLPLRPRLGVTWNPPRDGDPAGVTLNSVLADSIAERAGLKTGDRMTKFAGETITDGEQLRRLVAQSHGATAVEVQRAGDEAPLQLELLFPGGPPRLGISWRDNDGEPGVVAVVNVIPGSPAEAAGVERLDRICRIGGKDFASSDDFQLLAASANGPTEMLIERDGRLLNLTVAIGQRSAADASGDGE